MYSSLENISVLECYAEYLPVEEIKFDVVFARQAMHHAYHLDKFISAAYSNLKKDGILMTVRDHVVSDENEKLSFFKRHPLHKFYGGENAFSEYEYKNAMIKAGFKILKTLKHSDSVINFYPWNKDRLSGRLKILNKIPFITDIAWKYLQWCWNKMPGRLYTFIAKKT